MEISEKLYTAKNYARYLLSGSVSIDGDLPYSKEKLELAFRGKGIVPAPYYVDISAYKKFVEKARYPDDAYGDYFAEKSLEHFLSFQFSDINKQSLVLDVANAWSPFPQIINDFFGCKVISNDLAFPPGEVVLENWHTQIGCSACNLPLNDASVDLITLHCALEMFEGNDDINLVKEASRILKTGGKMVVIPLYMNEVHHILRDPKNSRKVLPNIDEGSALIYRRNFWGVTFSRFYSADAFCTRILANVKDHMKFNLYKFINSESVGKNVYLSWIGVFEKVSSEK
jgi:SAM-dependent methyltransferase